MRSKVTQGHRASECSGAVQNAFVSVASMQINFFLEGGGVEILSLTGNETKLQLGSEGL